MEKDVMIKSKSTKAGEDKSGNQMISVSLDKENTTALLEALQGIADSPRGVKLQLHIATREGSQGSFLSTFFFVKPIGEPQAGGFTKGPAKKGGYTPRTGVNSKQIG